MLPFLSPKKMSSVIIGKTKPDGSVESQGPEDEFDPGLMAAAEDLIAATSAKDAEGVARALKAAYDICCSQEPVGEGGDL